MTDPAVNHGVPKPYRPSAGEIDRLLTRAAKHPLGTAFLVNGALDSVAATFGVHAFVVEAARRRAPSRDRPAATASSPSGR